jgi:hypothetical protein
MTDDTTTENRRAYTPAVNGWVRVAPTKFDLAPNVATVCQKAAAKRRITLEQWLGEAIFNALVDEHEPTCPHCGADNVATCKRSGDCRWTN